VNKVEHKLIPNHNKATMPCREVEENLYLFLCDELEEEESQAISAHLFSCKNCRKSLAETVRVVNAISGALPRVPMQFLSKNN
jgi:anti-sigma factor RsiW